MKKGPGFIFSLFFLVILSVGFISAGIGIKWSQESAMINENEKTCMSYSVYNPWPEDSYVAISLGGELNNVLIMQEAQNKLIPADTSSSNAIPVEFCFKVPTVYNRDCLIVGKLLCELKCNEEQKVYEGEVIVQSVPAPAQISGTGGSATQMAVSAPLRIRVRCNPYARDYTLLYVLIAAISGLIVAILLIKKYRKPKIERDREKLRKLKEKLARESRSEKKPLMKKK